MSDWWKTKSRLPNGHAMWGLCAHCGWAQVYRCGQKMDENGRWYRDRMQETPCANCGLAGLGRVPRAKGILSRAAYVER